MSKTKLILAQESHFSVVFEEGKKMLKELIKKNYPKCFPTLKNGVGRKKILIPFYTPTSPETVVSHLNAQVVWIFRTCTPQFFFICLPKSNKYTTCIKLLFVMASILLFKFAKVY